MRARHLDRRMQALILNNFISRYKIHGVFDENKIINSLPPQLQLKVAVGQYTHIAQAPFFTDLGFECTAMLCSGVEHHDVSKETSVFEEGDMGTEGYFILSGEVEVEARVRMHVVLHTPAVGRGAFWGGASNGVEGLPHVMHGPLAPHNLDPTIGVSHPICFPLRSRLLQLREGLLDLVVTHFDPCLPQRSV